MKREESLGFLFNHVARLLVRKLHDRISPLGVVPGQFVQLMVLYERDGMTQQELSEVVGIEQPTMANTLARMERDGLVERRDHPTDGRKQIIVLTEKSRALRGQLIEAARSVNAQATGGLSEADRSALLRLITEVKTNLDRPH